MSGISYLALFLALYILCYCIWVRHQASAAKAKRKFIESKLAEGDQSRLDNEDRKRGI